MKKTSGIKIPLSAVSALCLLIAAAFILPGCTIFNIAVGHGSDTQTGMSPGSGTTVPPETVFPVITGEISSDERRGADGTTSVPPVSAEPYDSTSAPDVTSAPAETSAKPVIPAIPDDLTVTWVAGTKDVWKLENGVLTFGRISADSEYSISGSFNGSVVIDAGNDFDFVLDLSGVTLNSADRCPVEIVSAGNADISAQKGTRNVIYDRRAAVTDEDAVASAIWADCDLTLKGKGSLIVISENNNGIHTKDDLKVKNLTVSVTCVDNALKGNDSVTVESGTLTLIATGGDGIRTSSSDISSKGNQKGTVSVTGGTVNIYAACDGIDAAYNAEISGDETVVNVFTGKYSEYSGTVAPASAVTNYLRIPSSVYGASYRYAVKFYNSADDAKWVTAYYAGTQQTGAPGGRGMGASYYVYTFEKPSGYANMKVYRFMSSQTENSDTSFDSCSPGGTVNGNLDMFDVSYVASGRITGDWSNYRDGRPGGPGGPGAPADDRGNSSEYSAKGIKAHNEAVISGGSVSVSSSDDSVHAKGGEQLENKAAGLGNVRISGGVCVLTSLDDAVHADARLYISGGSVTVRTAYEGLEANGIEISGGDIDVYATDDGINAAGRGFSAYVKISGGNVNVSVGAGDTDGIDSNGSYTQTGGFVFTSSQSGDNSGMASALDLDGTCRVTAGTLIVAGTAESSPSSGSVNLVRFGSGRGGMTRPGQPGGISGGSSFAAGTWTLKDQSGAEILSFTLEKSCGSLLIASDELKTGGKYTLSCGSTSKTWTQTSSSVTVSQ